MMIGDPLRIALTLINRRRRRAYIIYSNLCLDNIGPLFKTPEKPAVDTIFSDIK